MANLFLLHVELLFARNYALSREERLEILCQVIIITCRNVCIHIYTMLGAVKCVASNCVTNDEMNGKEDSSKTREISSRISLARERSCWKVTFHRTHWIDFVDHDNVDVRQLQPDERSLHGLDNVFPR